MPRREVEDLLPVRRLDDAAHVRRDQRPAREHAEVDGLEVAEERVVALDREHRLPRRDQVAVVQRAHLEVVVAVRAELQDRDRLVHPAEHRLLLLEHLQQHARVPPVREERRARVVEVGVRVVAVPDLLDRELEHLGVEAVPHRSSGAACAAPWRELLKASASRPLRLLLTLARSTRAHARAQARVACGVRDLDLLRRRLRGRESALELEPRPGERAGERVSGVAVHPREHLHRRPESGGRPEHARDPAGGPRDGRGCRVRERRGEEGPISCEPRGCSFGARSPPFS